MCFVAAPEAAICIGRGRAKRRTVEAKQDCLCAQLSLICCLRRLDDNRLCHCLTLLSVYHPCSGVPLSSVALCGEVLLFKLLRASEWDRCVTIVALEIRRIVLIGMGHAIWMMTK